jgi:hypothetical protein
MTLYQIAQDVKNVVLHAAVPQRARHVSPALPIAQRSRLWR